MCENRFFKRTAGSGLSRSSRTADNVAAIEDTAKVNYTCKFYSRFVECPFLFQRVEKVSKNHQELRELIVKNKVACFMDHDVEINKTASS